MRTTFDLDDDLAISAKKAAAERRCSVRSLVEEGLRLVLAAKPGLPSLHVEDLAGLGRNLWTDTPSERYVRDLRKGWKG